MLPQSLDKDIVLLKKPKLLIRAQFWGAFKVCCLRGFIALILIANQHPHTNRRVFEYQIVILNIRDIR